MSASAARGILLYICCVCMPRAADERRTRGCHLQVRQRHEQLVGWRAGGSSWRVLGRKVPPPCQLSTAAALRALADAPEAAAGEPTWRACGGDGRAEEHHVTRQQRESNRQPVAVVVVVGVVALLVHPCLSFRHFCRRPRRQVTASRTARGNGVVPPSLTPPPPPRRPHFPGGVERMQHARVGGRAG